MACGCGATEKTTLTAPGHSWVDADCDTPKTCSVCSATEGSALGHTNAIAVKENEVAPDCDDAGSYDSVIYCSVCKAEVSRENVTVDALGHTEAAVVV